MRPVTSQSLTKSRRLLEQTCLGIALAAVSHAATAADYTWDGGDIDDNLWGSGDNWVGNAAPFPGSGNSLIFAGTTRLTPHNNYGDGDDFFNITFDATAGAFTVNNSGTNGIDWFGGIYNNSTTNQTIGFRLYQSSSNSINATNGDVTLNSSALLFRNGQNLTLNAASGKSIHLNSVIADGGGGAGSAISISGGGTTNFGAANTFTSGMIIKSGAARATTHGVTSFGSGNIQIGDTVTGADASLVTADGVFTVFANTISVASGAGIRQMIAQSNNSGQSPSFSGNVTLNNALTLTTQGAGGLRLNGVVNDGAASHGLIVDSTGAGAVRLNQANTFDGGIQIKRGTLEQNTAAGALGTGAVVIGDTSGNNNATLLASGTGFTATNAITINAGNTGQNTIASSSGNSFVYSGAVSLNNHLRTSKDAAGNLTLSNTITGSATTGNTYSITNVGSGSGTVILSGVISNGANGGNVELVQNSPTSILSVTNRSNLSIGTVTIKSGTFRFDPTVGVDGAYNITSPITLGDAALNADVVLSLGARAGTTNTISVLGSGSHTISLTHNNSGQIHLIGPIVFNSNDLVLNVTSSSGARIQGGVTGIGNIYINNSNSSGNGVDFRTVAVNNTGFIRNDSTGVGGVSQGTAVSIGGNVTSLIQNSTTSLWNVNQANGNFVGIVQVLAGTMAVTHASGLNANNAVSVAAGATFDVRDVDLTIAGLNDVSGTGGSVTDTTAASVRTLTLAGSASYSYSGIITAATPANMAVTKSGSGTQILSGNNSYAGATNITAGTLKIGHANALGTTAGTTSISSGATLDLNGQSLAEVFTAVDGSGVGGNGAIINSNTSTGAAITSELINLGHFTVGGAGDLTLTRVSRNLPRTLTKVGSGTLTLSGNQHNNLYAVAANGGQVHLAKSAGYAADRGLSIDNGAVVKITGTTNDQLGDVPEVLVLDGTFNLNGQNETAGKLTIGDGNNNGIVSGGSGSTYTVNSTYTHFGVNEIASISTIEARSGSVDVHLAGNVALNKTTAGVVTLNQSNSYTGITTIDAGKLIVDSTHSGGDNYVVNAGTLGGSGTLDLAAGKSVQVNSNGTVAPGSSPGILAIDGDFTMSPSVTSTLEIEVGNSSLGAGIGFDQLIVTGAVSVKGARLNVIPISGAAAGMTYEIVDASNYDNSSPTDNFFAQLNEQAATHSYTANGGFKFNVSYINGDGIYLTLVAVPEPASMLTLGCMNAALLMRRRTSPRRPGQVRGDHLQRANAIE